MDEVRLATATRAAAERLAGTAISVGASGATLSCTFAGGAHVIVRNSLHPAPPFSTEHLLNQISSGIVRALLAGTQ